MPISTDNGKLAIMEWDQDYEPGLPLSPGSLGQDDQQQLLWGFPEVLWGAVEVEVEVVGGVFRRRGAISSLFRRYFPMSTPIQFDTLPQDQSESVLYVFDYSRFPEMKSGETLSSPEIGPATPSGLTIGTPVVTTVDRIVDAGGTVVEAGKGIEVTISAEDADAGTYTLECRGTFSGGARRVVKGAIEVE